MNRYRFKLSDNPHDSHHKIINIIEKRSTVLEVGTARGHMTEFMTNELECIVDGIDIDSDMLEEASKFLRNKYLLNLDCFENLDTTIGDNKYDFVILADVLEHCLNPLDILRVLLKKVKANGKVIISIPNISHNSILLELINDRFSYQTEGILDYSHVRFYTKGSFSYIVKNLDCKIIDYDYTYMTPIFSGLGDSYHNQSIFSVETLLRNNQGHVFQNIFVIARNDSVYDEINHMKEPSNYYYDEIRVDFNGNIEVFSVFEKEVNLKVLVNKDVETFTIYPSIKNRKAIMKIFSQRESNHSFSGIFSCEDGISLINKNSKIILNGDFKVGDEINVNIVYFNYSDIELERKMISDNSNDKNIVEINKLKKLITEHEIISFDIFDTLLLRDVIEPTDIFKIVEKKYLMKFSKKIDFYNKRIEAENKARIKSTREDVTLKEIYDELSNDFYNESEILKSLEIESELEFIKSNEHMLSIFNLAIELNKKVILISDMYLPEHIIVEMLNKCNVKNYYEIFVSSELMKTKASGSLYKYVKEKVNISNKKLWLHIGDNEIADSLNPINFGINAYHYKKIYERYMRGNISNLSESIMAAITIRYSYLNLSDSEYWEKFGVDIAFPLYASMTLWISKLLKGKKNAFFLARDGYILHKMYSIIQEKSDSLPEGKYIYASRRAYQYPHLLKLDKNEAIATLTAYNTDLGQQLTLSEIYRNIGLCGDKYETILSSFQINSADDVIEYGESLHRIRKFLSYIWDDIEVKLQEENELLLRYMKKMDMCEVDEINIVDIGWRGSTQRAIYDILENNNINGYYLGTIEQMYSELMSKSYGYLFDLGLPYDRRQFVMNNVMMFEFLFSAPHGSLIKFKMKDGELKPILKNVEKNSYNYECISKVHNAAIDVFKELVEKLEYLDYLSPEFAMNNIIRFIEDKNLDDLIKFANLTNTVGFGNTDDLKKYVTEVNIKDFNENRDEILANSFRNLWSGAIIINDRSNKISISSYHKLNKGYHTSKIRNLSNKISRCKELLIKGLKNPFKGLKYMIKYVKRKIIYKRKLN